MHPRVADALPGRVDYLTLWPFSQAELAERRSTFLDRVFAGKSPATTQPPIGRAGYADRVIRGGFPEVVGAIGRELGIDYKTVAKHVRTLLREKLGDRFRPASRLLTYLLSGSAPDDVVHTRRETRV